jgi:hypothetical protein
MLSWLEVLGAFATGWTEPVGVAFAEERLGLLLRLSALAGSMGDVAEAATGGWRAGLGLAESMVVGGYHMRRRRCAVAAVGRVVGRGGGDEDSMRQAEEWKARRREGEGGGGGRETEERRSRDGRDLAGRRWLMSGAFVWWRGTHAHPRACARGEETGSACGRRRRRRRGQQQGWTARAGSRRWAWAWASG